MATAGKLKFAALFISVFLFFLLLICFCLIFSLMCFICVPRAVPAATASQKVQFDCQKMCATPSTKWGKEGVAVTPIFKCCQRATFGGTANWRRQLQKAVAICSVTCLCVASYLGLPQGLPHTAYCVWLWLPASLPHCTLPVPVARVVLCLWLPRSICLSLLPCLFLPSCPFFFPSLASTPSLHLAFPYSCSATFWIWLVAACHNF